MVDKITKNKHSFICTSILKCLRDFAQRVIDYRSARTSDSNETQYQTIENKLDMILSPSENVTKNSVYFYDKPDHNGQSIELLLNF